MKALRLLLQLGLIGLSFVWLYPLLWMLSASFKTESEFFRNNFRLWPSRLDFSSYERAWQAGRFELYFVNSIVITASVILLVLLISAVSGYAIGRYSFRGKATVVSVLTASVFVPIESAIIPIFQLIKDMGLLNSLLGVILAEAGGGNILFVLLFAGFFRQVPKELGEAAVVDGCGFLRTFWTVMLPIAKPVVGSVVVMQFIWCWNSFLMPLVLTLGNPELRTVAVGLYALKGENVVDWSGIAAGGVITLVPVIIVFLSLQRLFVNGLAGAVKG
ncbi:carbohydrate ABC transporter permease [Cohnella massiliensis]|uniref:carbohydrate ABC transporter permease n=1 Tax=Cohnella massiliensis TaxID=1816691 RepID=UPI001FE705F4|nr:carbohydrate ABC transporter permease [Cohnella massiliensis]